MTIIQAIERANEMRSGNAVTDELKVKWLIDCDHMIYNEVLSRYVFDPPLPEWQDYEDDTANLLVEAPYDDLYIWYLMSKIDLAQQEYDDYNVSATMFTEVFDRYKRCLLKTKDRKYNPEIKVGVF